MSDKSEGPTHLVPLIFPIERCIDVHIQIVFGIDNKNSACLKGYINNLK